MTRTHDQEYPAPDQPRGEQCADLGAGTMVIRESSSIHASDVTLPYDNVE